MGTGQKEDRERKSFKGFLADGRSYGSCTEQIQSFIQTTY